MSLHPPVKRFSPLKIHSPFRSSLPSKFHYICRFHARCVVRYLGSHLRAHATLSSATFPRSGNVKPNTTFYTSAMLRACTRGQEHEGPRKFIGWWTPIRAIDGPMARKWPMINVKELYGFVWFRLIEIFKQKFGISPPAFDYTFGLEIELINDLNCLQLVYFSAGTTQQSNWFY